MNLFFRDIERVFDDVFLSPQISPLETRHPAIYEENDDEYLMTLDMPGIPRDKLKLETLGNRVTISGERKGRGKIERSFSIPPYADTSRAQAQYQDGVLAIRIPKGDAAKPRQIAIMETAKQLT